MEPSEPEGELEYVFIAIDEALLDDTRNGIIRKHGRSKMEGKKCKGRRSPTDNPDDMSIVY